MNRSTIVIPNYNGIKYMEKCLLSLAGEPADIIVVDNGSVDGSREVVEQKFPEVRCIAWKENRGFCEAVNAGIRESKTPYVILLNNDTEVEKGFVRALEHALDRDDRLFSGAAQMRNLHHRELIDDAGDYYCALGWAFARGKDRPVDSYQKTCEIFAACGGACIYRRRFLTGSDALTRIILLIWRMLIWGTGRKSTDIVTAMYRRRWSTTPEVVLPAQDTINSKSI